MLESKNIMPDPCDNFRALA